jgi:alkanesulfonate monooxygenase SsuD/methylene tetrahydromethanopterin reductase-like flavin-dependent oxidoreductase (luciferase family)
LSQGWIGSGFVTIEAFAEDAARFRAAVARAGGDPSGPVVAKRLYVHLPAACAGEDRDLEAAVRRRGAMGDRFRAAVSSGSADRCLADLARVLDGGADHVILDPVVATPEHVDAVLELVDRAG